MPLVKACFLNKIDEKRLLQDLEWIKSCILREFGNLGVKKIVKSPMKLDFQQCYKNPAKFYGTRYGHSEKFLVNIQIFQ